MTSTVEEISNLKRKLNINVPAETVKNIFDRAYRVMQKKARVPGFRKGKVPLSKVRQSYGNEVKKDVLEELIQNQYVNALTEHSLNPVNHPKIDFTDLKDDSEFCFSAEFEVFPDVKLKKWSGFELKKEKLELKEEDVEKVLENLQKKHSKKVDVDEVRPAKMGDVAIIDFEGFVNEKPLEGGQGNNHSLELGSKSFIDNFEEEIVGMNCGDKKTINLKFPDGYHAKELSGQPVKFNVTLHKLQKLELPELNEDFFKSLGAQEKTPKEFKEKLRNEMEKSETKRIKEQLEQQIIDVLIKENPIDIPESMQTQQKESIINEERQRLKSQQGNQPTDDQWVEDYLKSQDAFFNERAKTLLQSSLLLDALVSDQKITCTNEDLENRISETAKEFQMDMETVKKAFDEDGRQENLKNQILTSKAMDVLIQNAEIKEVSKEEL